MRYPVMSVPFTPEAVKDLLKPGTFVRFNGTRSSCLREVVEVTIGDYFNHKSGKWESDLVGTNQVQILGWKMVTQFPQKTLVRDQSTENGLNKLRAVLHNGVWTKIKWVYGQNASLPF